MLSIWAELLGGKEAFHWLRLLKSVCFSLCSMSPTPSITLLPAKHSSAFCLPAAFAFCRVEGLKRAAAVAVGEKHSLAVQRWSAAQLEGMVAVPWLQQPAPAALPGAAAAAAAAAEEDDRWFQRAADGLMEDGRLATPRGLHQLEAEHSAADSAASPGPSPNVSPGKPSPVRLAPRRTRGGGTAAAVGPSSLQRICEEEVARRLVDPRTCLQVRLPAMLARPGTRAAAPAPQCCQPNS